MFTLNQRVFAPAQKTYRIGILFTHKNGSFGTISVKERSCIVPVSNVKGHLSDSFSCGRRAMRWSMNIALNIPPPPPPPPPPKKNHFHKWQAPLRLGALRLLLRGSPLQIDGIDLTSLITFSAPVIPVTTEVWCITVAWNRWVCTPWLTGSLVSTGTKGPQSTHDSESKPSLTPNLLNPSYQSTY